MSGTSKLESWESRKTTIVLRECLFSRDLLPCNTKIGILRKSMLIVGILAALPFAHSIQCYSGSFSSAIDCQATTQRPTTISSWSSWTYRPPTTYRPWHWHWNKPHRPWSQHICLTVSFQMTTFDFSGGITTTMVTIGTTGIVVGLT